MITTLNTKVVDRGDMPYHVWSENEDLCTMPWGTYVEWTLNPDIVDFDDPVDRWIMKNYPELYGTDFLIHRA